MTDAYDDERRVQMFPVLTDAQIARAELHATRRSLAAGETTFELGTADPGIHIVLSGAREVVRPWAAGDDLVTVLSAWQFTGEVSSLSGRPTLVRGRMREARSLSTRVRHPVGKFIEQPDRWRPPAAAC
jgi:thioredoxin reductase (NADPH)